MRVHAESPDRNVKFLMAAALRSSAIQLTAIAFNHLHLECLN